MTKKMQYIVPISKGLLDKKHTKLVANPLGLFMFLIDRTTREEGGEGHVLGGKPLAFSEIAEVFGVATRTVRRWRAELEGKYIRTVHTNDFGKLRWYVLKSKKLKRAVMTDPTEIGRTEVLYPPTHSVGQKCPTTHDRSVLPPLGQKCPTPQDRSVLPRGQKCPTTRTEVSYPIREDIEKTLRRHREKTGGGLDFKNSTKENNPTQELMTDDQKREWYERMHQMKLLHME